MVDPKEKKMRNKKVVVNQLGEYFMKKGKILSIKEYKEASDAPIRWLIVKRIFNSWSRMESFVNKAFPEIGTVVPAPAPTAAPKAAPKKVAKKVVEDE